MTDNDSHDLSLKSNVSSEDEKSSSKRAISPSMDKAVKRKVSDSVVRPVVQFSPELQRKPKPPQAKSSVISTAKEPNPSTNSDSDSDSEKSDEDEPDDGEEELPEHARNADFHESYTSLYTGVCGSFSLGANLSESEKQRRERGPPAPIVTDSRFLMMLFLFFQFCVLGSLWWGWRNETASSSFVVLLLINSILAVGELFYFRSILAEHLPSMYTTWWDENETVRRKMRAVISNVSHENRKLFVLNIIVYVLWGTLFCGAPAIVLQGDWWYYFNQLDANSQALFIFFLIFLFLCLLVVLYFHYKIANNIQYCCGILSDNANSILISRQKQQQNAKGDDDTIDDTVHVHVH